MKRTLIVATGNEEKMVEIRQIFASTDIELITMKEAGFDIEVEETGETFEENALIKARAVAASSGQIAIADDSGLEVDAMPGELGIYSARWLGHETSYDIKNREIIRRVDEYCARKESAGGVCVPEKNMPAAGKGSGAEEVPAAGKGFGAEEVPAAGKGSGAEEAPAAITDRHPGCLPDGTPGPDRSARFISAVAAVWPDGKERTATGVLEGRIYTKQKGHNGFGYDPIFYLPEYGTTSGDIPREEKNRISHRGQAFRKLRDILEDEPA